MYVLGTRVCAYMYTSVAMDYLDVLNVMKANMHLWRCRGWS